MTPKCFDLSTIAISTVLGSVQSDELTSIIVSALTAILAYLSKIAIGKIVRKLPPPDDDAP
jgi:hypothetical protein